LVRAVIIEGVGVCIIIGVRDRIVIAGVIAGVVGRIMVGITTGRT
jgi:hypothetical protein